MNSVCLLVASSSKHVVGTQQSLADWTAPPPYSLLLLRSRRPSGGRGGAALCLLVQPVVSLGSNAGTWVVGVGTVCKFAKPHWGYTHITVILRVKTVYKNA